MVKPFYVLFYINFTEFSKALSFYYFTKLYNKFKFKLFTFFEVFAMFFVNFYTFLIIYFLK